MASLDGCTSEVQLRGYALLADPVAVEAGIYVVSAKRDPERQRFLWLGWLKRLPGFNPANPPGTSEHEFGRAIDFGNYLNLSRAEWKTLLRKYGFYQRHRHEDWHGELDPTRAPLPVVIPAPTPEEEEEDMSALTIVWSNGSKAIADRNGGVFTAGCPFHGSMHSLKDEFKVGFDEVVAFTAVDIDNPAAGYIFWDQRGAQFQFPTDPKFLKK